MKRAVLHIFAVFFCAQTFTLAFNSATCCQLAQSKGLFVNPPPPDQISCGNTFIDDSIPAAASLFVSYDFCRSECSGFKKSEWGAPAEWAAPIVQFLLPSIIFSMSIPRHVQFLSSDILEKAWIKDDAGHARRLLISLLLLPLSLVFAALDTIFWVVLIMSMAGPMMVAGLHEAMLDYKILSALDSGEVPMPQGLHAVVELLVVVVSGNLRLDGSVEPGTTILAALLGRDQTVDAGSDAQLNTDAVEAGSEHIAMMPQATGMLSAGQHPEGEGSNEIDMSENIFHPHQQRASQGQSSSSLRHHSSTSQHSLQQQPPLLQPLEFVSPSAIQHLPSRLMRLVTSQLPFGAIVGAPVVFYMGSFIYTVLDLLDNPSDQDRAISIAYGVEWMIIVHVAIVSGTLLASNNPSPVMLLVGQPATAPTVTTPSRVFPPVHGGEGFETVSMWRRGMNKQDWLERTEAWREGEEFRKAMQMRPCWEWFWIGVFTVILISLPAAAGAFVSWRTPPVGWSCRSLSFVLYMGVEVVLTPLYFLWLTLRRRRGVLEWLRELWEKTSSLWQLPRDRVHEVFVQLLWQVGLFLLFLPTFCLAVTAGVVLTLLQIIGVYRNCFCYVTTWYWFRLHEAAVDVATDTHEQRNSSGGWIKVGIVATAFMAVCTLLAWWFQRYVRGLYELVIRKTVSREHFYRPLS